MPSKKILEETEDFNEKISLYNGEVIIDYNDDNHVYKINGEIKNSMSKIVDVLDKPALKFWATNEYFNAIYKLIIGKDIKVQDFDKDDIKLSLEDGLINEKWDNEFKDFLNELDTFIDNDGTIQLKDLLNLRYSFLKVSKDATDIGTEVHNFAEQYALAIMNNKETPQVSLIADNKVKKGINGFLKWLIAQDIEFVEVEKAIYSKEFDFIGRTDLICKIDGKLTLLDYKTSKEVYQTHKIQACGYVLAYEEEMKQKIEKVVILHLDKLTGEFHYYELSSEEIEVCKEQTKLLSQVLKNNIKLSEIEKQIAKNNKLNKKQDGKKI